MKHFILLLFILSKGFIAKSQFTELNQKIVGGGLSFNTSNNSNSNLPRNEVKGASFSTNVSFGKFVKQNWLSSYGMSYVNSNSKTITPTNTTTNPVNNFAVFYSRTYFKEVAKKLYFGIGSSATIVYGTATVKETANTFKSKSQTLLTGINLFPQLSYQLTKKFVLSLSPTNHFLYVGYNYATIKHISPNQPTTTGKSQSFSIDGGFWSAPFQNLSVGFSYLLKK